MLRVVEECGAELVEFSETVEAAGSGLFRRFELARPYLEADRVINLPKLKTHEMMTMTCAVKNLFGAVVGHGKAAWHLKAGADRELFARMLLEIYLLRPPDLTIVDAVTAMEGNGPASGDPVPVGLLLAGANAVAVDVIAAEIAGIPHRLLYLERTARKLGIDGADRPGIETAGVPLAEARVAPFRLPPISDVQFGLPTFLKNRLRHYLTTRPCAIPEKCRLCGICADACPPRAIEVRDGRLVFDYHRCIRCFCCRELCPDGALDVKEGGLLRIARKLR
jgi:ferredoxin